MKNEPGGRLERLFDLARRAKDEPSPREEGFESRVLARVREERERKRAWSSWAWRLAPLLLALVVFLGLWNYVSYPVSPPDLYAAISGGGEEEQFVHLWTGE